MNRQEKRAYIRNIRTVRRETYNKTKGAFGKNNRKPMPIVDLRVIPKSKRKLAEKLGKSEVIEPQEVKEINP